MNSLTSGWPDIQASRVVGGMSTGKQTRGMELGAGRYVALDTDRLDDVAGQADVVFDTIGGEVLAGSAALLRPGGTLVTIKADAGHLRPQVGAVYPLAQAVEAYSAKAAGGIPGRIILQP